MANYIQDAPWKIPFSTTGSGPYAVKMKLADLLFDTSTPSWTARTLTQVGVHLPHDIILFDPTIYLDGGGTLDDTASRDLRQSRGFYLSKVTYDARANATWVANSAYKPVTDTADPHVGQSGYYIYPAEASLPPLEEDYTLRSGKTYLNTGIINNLTDRLDPNGPADDSTNPLMTYQSSCTVATTGTTAASSSFIILSATDRSLQATIPGSSLIPFTRMYFQTDIATIPEIAEILRFFTGFGVAADGTTPLIDPLTGEAYTAADLVNPSINTLLQSIEIWVRCSYFADYIIPDTFDQDLTATSNVSHKNLVIGSGDFKRFTRESESAEIAPYLPSTPPRIDLLTIGTTDAAPFPVPSRTGSYSTAGTGHRAPLGWYDPEYPDTANIAGKLLKLPTQGNAYTSGRLFSPTIDEIWTYLKKLVDGRPIDTEASSVAKPKGTAARATIEDTRIPAEPSLALPAGKEGDPLNTSGTSFTSAPDTIQYVFDSNIKTTMDAIIVGIDGASYLAPKPTPRANPLSLRELEADIKNTQFVAQTLAKYLAANFTVRGNTSTAQGTLYQLHRDYSTATPDSVKWLTFANTRIPTETAASYGSSLPAPTDYNYQQSISREDVYLSAEGYWRYLFDHVRVPVLAETY